MRHPDMVQAGTRSLDWLISVQSSPDKQFAAIGSSGFYERGATLIETPRGWLILYHGVRRTAAGCLYRLGVALLDLETAEHCILRGDSWIFGPEAPYEREGDDGCVTFPCGYTLGDDGDVINLCYGAADTSIAPATGSVGQLLDWLDRHGTAA